MEAKSEYVKLEDYTRRLFQRGTEIAAERGLILVDTKYEFGKFNDEIHLIDEIHAPDSSRYFYVDTYEDLQNQQKPQRQLSKEFVRRWLIDHDFQGLEGQSIPEMSDEFIGTITDRYIELFENITGDTFLKSDQNDTLNRIEQNILKAL